MNEKLTSEEWEKICTDQSAELYKQDTELKLLKNVIFGLLGIIASLIFLIIVT